MEAKELRIGNYYAIAETQGIVYTKVKELKYNKFGNLSSGNHNLELAAKPIPLTEEWLLKFGGNTDNENTPYLSLYKYSDLRLYCITVDGEVVGVQKCKSNYMPISNYRHIKYVHQLQNLYFALLGEELTLKE